MIIIIIVIIKVKTAPITGYAVFADGKRVTDVDSPSSDDHDDYDHDLDVVLSFCAHFA